MSTLRLIAGEIVDWNPPRLALAAAGTPPTRPPSGSEISVGEMVRRRFIVPSGLSVAHYAQQWGIDKRELCAVVGSKIAITADMARALAEASGMTPMFFVRLQDGFGKLCSRQSPSP